MKPETIQEQVIARAMKDPAFRQAMLSNPRAVLAREYNVHLPAHLMVRVLEETPNTFTLVLPAQEEATMELIDECRHLLFRPGSNRPSSNSRQ